MSHSLQDSQTVSLSFEERLDASPMTYAMWRLWMLSAGLIALDGFDFFVIGVALPLIEQDFGLDPTTVGAIAVAAIAGSLVGSLTLGPLTDQIGRQQMLVIDIVLFLVASAATALAWSATALIVFRFCVGVAIGADYPLSVAYITENVPARLRGRLVIGAFTFQAVGALLGAVTGFIVLSIFRWQFPDSLAPAVHYAWRWMLGVGLVGAIAVAMLRFSFRLESPRYYIARGEYKAAAAAASLLLNQPIAIDPDTEPQPPATPLRYTALFSAQYIQRTILTSVPWFLQDIATYGIGVFTPVIIAALAFSSQTDFIARQLASAKGSAFVDVFLIAGFLLAVILVDRVGRIPLQMIGFIGMAFGLLLLALSTYSSTESSHFVRVFIGFIIFNLCMNLGPNSTTFLLSGEVFPTAIRASGAGFAAAFAKAGAVLGTFGLPILNQSLGTPILLQCLAIACGLAAIITYLFRVETMGRSLESVDLVSPTTLPDPNSKNESSR